MWTLHDLVTEARVGANPELTAGRRLLPGERLLAAGFMGPVWVIVEGALRLTRPGVADAEVRAPCVVNLRGLGDLPSLDEIVATEPSLVYAVTPERVFDAPELRRWRVDVLRRVSEQVLQLLALPAHQHALPDEAAPVEDLLACLTSSQRQRVLSIVQRRDVLAGEPLTTEGHDADAWAYPVAGARHPRFSLSPVIAKAPWMQTQLASQQCQTLVWPRASVFALAATSAPFARLLLRILLEELAAAEQRGGVRAQALGVVSSDARQEVQVAQPAVGYDALVHSRLMQVADIGEQRAQCATRRTHMRTVLQSLAPRLRTPPAKRHLNSLGEIFARAEPVHFHAVLASETALRERGVIWDFLEALSPLSWQLVVHLVRWQPSLHGARYEDIFAALRTDADLRYGRHAHVVSLDVAQRDTVWTGPDAFVSAARPVTSGELHDDDVSFFESFWARQHQALDPSSARLELAYRRGVGAWVSHHAQAEPAIMLTTELHGKLVSSYRAKVPVLNLSPVLAEHAR